MKDKVIKLIRKYFGVTDPKFQPVSQMVGIVCPWLIKMEGVTVSLLFLVVSD